MKRKHTALVLASACGLLLGGCSLEDIKNAPKSAWESTSNFFTDTWNKVTGKKTEDEPKKEEEHHEEEHHEEEHHEEEHHEEEHEEETPKVEITVFELPETLEIGGTLDLANYVSVVGADDYSVVLAEESKAIASVEGKVITALAEGEIKFEVVAGETKVSKSVVCAFGDRAKFVELTKDAGKNYTVYELDEDYDIDDIICHTDNYVLQMHYTVNDEGTMWVPGGYLTFTGEDCYEYILTSSNDVNYDTVEVNPVPEDPENLYYFNSEFSVDFSSAQYMYDEELECGSLVVRGNEAMIFAENSLMMPDGYVAYYTDETYTDWNFYMPSTVEFVYDEAVEDEPAYLEAYLYTDILSKDEELISENELFGIYVIYFDEESIGMSVLDEFVADESNIPEFHNYAEECGITGFVDYVIGNKYSSGFIYESYWANYAATTEEEFYVDMPASAATSVLRNAVNSSEIIYYNPVGIISTTGSNVVTGGKILYGDPAMVYDIECEEDKLVAYENQSLSSPWDAEEYDFSFLGSGGHLDYALNLLGSDSQENLVFGVLGAYVPQLFIDLACLTNSMIPLTSDLVYYYNNGVNYFSYMDAKLVMGSSDLHFTFDLNWDGNVHYLIEYTFMFGVNTNGMIEYVIPMIEFPAE